MSDLHAPAAAPGTLSGEARPRERRNFLFDIPPARQGPDIDVQEAEHRARNLIHLAAGLLRAQAVRTRAPSARRALESAADRLVALTVAYAHMEEPGADGRVRLDRQLRRLCRAWDGEDGGRKVSLSTDAQPLTAPAQMARAIGLLANEAITNALKHAYAGMDGKVTVRLHRCAPGRVRLSIEDGGRGLTGAASEGFGFTLMRTLAEQLDGELQFRGEDGHGTLILVEFPDSSDIVGPEDRA